MKQSREPYFFMTNKKVSSQIIRKMSNECPRALSLWVCLKDVANNYGVAVASQQALAEMLHVKSRQSVYKAIRYLHKNHYIMIGKIGNQNAYILNPNIVWQTAHNYGRKALADRGITFPGVITLTKKENRRLYDQYKKFVKNNKPVPAGYSLKKLSLKQTKQGKATKNGEPIKHHNHYTSAKGRRQSAKIKILRKKLRAAQQSTQRAKGKLTINETNKKQPLNYNQH